MPLPTFVLRLAAGLAVLSPALTTAAEIIRPRVVIVTMFERGEDTGDAPGEFQYWVEREHLDRENWVLIRTVPGGAATGPLIFVYPRTNAHQFFRVRTE